jgi:hypothetical protein
LKFNEADEIENVLIVPEQSSPADRFFGRLPEAELAGD